MKKQIIPVVAALLAMAAAFISAVTRMVKEEPFIDGIQGEPEQIEFWTSVIVQMAFWGVIAWFVARKLFPSKPKHSEAERKASPAVGVLTDSERDQMESFFSGYFHQDWTLEADTTEAVVREYASEHTAEELATLHNAILKYIASYASDDDLRNDLLHGLGCYYRPEADGLTPRLWLQQVATQLEALSQLTAPPETSSADS